MFDNISLLSLQLRLNSLMYDRNILGPLRQSSVIFGNLGKMFGNVWKMFGNVCQAFGTILENIRKSSESGRKPSENRQKQCHQHVYIIYEYEDMNFMFLWHELSRT